MVTLTPGPPQITLVNPLEDETQVALDSIIEATFSEPMNQSATQQAFSITPSVLGDFSWAGDKLIFIPQSQFNQGITYTVEITADAKDLENETLDGDLDGVEEGSPLDDFSWQFTAMSETPKVDSVFPLHGTQKVFTDTDVIINFTKGMDTQTTIDALSYEVDSINFPLSSNGQSLWTLADSTLTFTPNVNFQHDKLYTFNIEYTATDATGGSFDGDGDGTGGEVGEDDYVWSFTTIAEPPKVQTIFPKNYATKVEADTIISVKFSKEMDQTSVEDAFTYSHDETNTTWDSSDGNVTWTSLSKMEFNPDENLEYEVDYTIRIEATATDSQGITLDGNKNKKPEGVEIDSYEWTFSTIAEPPKILSFEPSENAKDVLLDADIVINFDRAMDTKETEDAFSYSYEGSIDSSGSSSGLILWTNSDRTMTFTPDTEYEEGKRYTVTVDETAEDTEGIKFGEFFWTFTTKINSEPLLEGGGVHPEKGDTATSFTFSVVYSDEDDDEPVKINVVIDGVKYPLDESDPTQDSFIEGKTYEYSIELYSGTLEYYFMVENEKHEVRFPEGDVTRSLKVSAVDPDKVFGIFEEEYVGMPTMICMPLGLIILVVIIVAVVMVSKKKRTRQAAVQSVGVSGSTMAFLPQDSGELMSFEPEPEGGLMSFEPTIEEDLMSFQTFDEAPHRVPPQPVMIQCPECGEHLKVKASVRPFQFPCKCGAKLVLK
jgi:hypothetical protein